MTGEELVAQLRPIRMPAEFAAFGWREALAAFSLGLLLTLLLLPIARPFLVSRDDPRAQAEAEIARLSREALPARLHGLATLLHRLGSRIPETLRPALYDPDAEADAAALEALIRDAARKARR